MNLQDLVRAWDYYGTIKRMAGKELWLNETKFT